MFDVLVKHIIVDNSSIVTINRDTSGLRNTHIYQLKAIKDIETQKWYRPGLDTQFLFRSADDKGLFLATSVIEEGVKQEIVANRGTLINSITSPNCIGVGTPLKSD